MGEILVGFGCVAYSFMPDAGFVGVGHKREMKAEGIRQRVTLLVSLIL